MSLRRSVLPHPVNGSQPHLSHEEQPNTAEQFAQRYPNAKRNGDGWLIPCPCHDDSDPSLSIKDGDRGILVHCFAGCDRDAVKDALGISNGQRPNRDEWLRKCLVAIYLHPDGKERPRYREDHDGECWRTDCTKSGPHKHIWGQKGRGSKGCYLLPWGDDAPDKVIVIVEGEKAAAALLRHVDGKGYTPVTWNGGASVSNSDFRFVNGREVILWPDADGPGKRAMQNAGKSASEAGASSIRLIDVSSLPDKADAADVDKDVTLALLSAATEYELPAEEPAASQPAARGIEWAILTERGGPQLSAPLNSEIALRELDGMDFAFNEFTSETILNGERADDDTVSMIRRRMQKDFGFCPTREALHEGFRNLCLDNSFHPVRDYLQGLQWDGKLRLPTFAQSYFDADGDPLVNAAARMIPYGMVGRILQPGVKFDYAVVLQGAQGCGKSSSLRILAGPEFHGESVPLTSNDSAKIVIERTRGKAIIELAELAGWYYSEAESTKAMISAQSDSARLAYGKMTVEVLRQFIFVGSTNNEKFLRDTTGNRRFPVVPCGNIDLQGLERDRDQILAEAVHDLQKILPGAITIPAALFEAQAAQAEERRQVGGFEEWLYGYLDNQAPGAPIVSEKLREAMKADLAGTPVYPGNTEFSQVMEGAGLMQARRGKDRVRQWVKK